MGNYELNPINNQFVVHVDDEMSNGTSPFIEANTIPVSLHEMKADHIIPVFVKENQPLISHMECIETTWEIANDLYSGETVLDPVIRVSHPIKGRVPEAKHKAADELLPWETTLYYERMMFAIEIPSIAGEIESNKPSLTIGGVKAYNQDNLYSRNQCDQHFKLFIGFQNKVCTNLCVWTDGLMDDVRVRDLGALKMHIHHLLERYRSNMHLEAMGELANHSITEKQFAQFIGKCRMFQHLPPSKKQSLKPILLGDQQLGMVVRDYYKDKSFCRMPDGTINLWRLYNLMTGANKSTYVDQFLDRSVNAYDLVEQVKWSLNGHRTSWYLS
jgi:hypothetical protein